MKKFLLTLLTAITAGQFASAQIIDIPDSNFKNALIEAGVDKNGDGEIQESEALEVATLTIREKSISSIKGIEYFTNLNTLDCGWNKINEVDLSNLIKLTSLKISLNRLTNLDVSKLTNLISLDCSGNQLTSLDLSSTKVLKELNIVRNPIVILYLKNGIKDNYEKNRISLYMTLKYICADEEDIEDLAEIAQSHVIINSLCGATLDGAFSTIEGEIKLDLNNDGCDESDRPYPFLKVFVTNEIDSGYVFSGMDGSFSVSLKSNITKFEPVLEDLDYYFVSPESVVYVLGDSVHPAFCITPKGNFNDLAVSLIPVRPARPGFSDATYKLVYKNQGTTTQSGSATFSFDGDRTKVISSAPVADLSEAGQLTFDFVNLAPFKSRSALITMRTNAPTDIPAVYVGDVLEFSAEIIGRDDETPEDNIATLHQTVMGSLDPNDKTCLQGDIISPDLVGKPIHYLIRFENTGTAPAENVVVTDYIDTTILDVNTLLITDASHECHTQISKGNKVQFIFNDIQLPFTEPNKHGYVAFSIQLKDHLQIGDSIKNQADIYFDYNLPITTNEAASEINIRTVTSVKQRIGNISLSVYPNPSKGDFSVELDSASLSPVQISVMDISGKIVFAKQYAAFQDLIPLQLNQLAQGTYLIRVEMGNEIISKKIVIQ